MGSTPERVTVNFKRRELVPNPSLTGVLDLQWRRRGEQLQNVKVRPQQNPRLANMLVRFFSAMADEEQLARLVEEQGDVLVESGLLVPAKNAPETVPSDPTLDPAHLALVPSRYREAYRKARRSRQRFTFDAEHVFLQETSKRPDAPWRGIPPEGHFPRGERMLWVFDPGTRIWSYYRLSKPELATIKALRRGTKRPADLSADVLETFAHARIVVTDEQRRARAASWASLSAELHRVGRHRWAIVRDVLPPLALANYRGYSRSLHREGYYYFDEEHVRDKLREYLRADALFAFVHRQSGELVRHVTGDALFPSWTMLSRYRSRADLPRHVDRDQCAWNGSIALDSEGAAGKPWPLAIVAGRRTEHLSLELGDLALYQGTETPHYRRPLGPRRTETIMLWFFVPVAFQGDRID